MTALLLIAHGSRRPEANADLEFVAAALRARGRYPVVRVAYLELAEPDIATAGAACAEDGATGVILVPYFLSPGWLKIDANFDPLRKNPRFEKLVAGK